MLVSTAIQRIKSETHDISAEYSNDECLNFLNVAIHQVFGLLIGYEYAPLVKEITLHDDDTLPHNFMRACGKYPIKVTNNIVKLLDGDAAYITCRYFASPDNLTSDSTELPFDHDPINEVVVKVAVLLALNENEYDISQDSNLTSALQQAVANGMGVSAS